MSKSFTDLAEKLLTFSQEKASTNKNNIITSEILLLGCVKYGNASKSLKKVGITEQDISNLIKKKYKVSNDDNDSSISYSQEAKIIIEQSMKESQKLNNEKIGTEHILLAIIYDKKSTGHKILKELNINLDELINETLKVRGLTSVAIERRKKWGFYLLIINIIIIAYVMITIPLYNKIVVSIVFGLSIFTNINSIWIMRLKQKG